MADREYRRLLCRTCGGAFTQSGPGRNAYACAECRAAKRTRAERIAQDRANSKHGFHCEHCGKYAIRQPGGSTKAGGYTNRWCSMDCRKAANTRVRSEVSWLRSMGAAHRRSRRVQSAFQEEQPRFLCKGCGQEAGRYKAFAQYCSEDCRAESQQERRRKSRAAFRRSSRGRALRKKQKTLRRAREAIVADMIDPIKVFERDRWRCHICHRSTPKRLRGTYDDRAPELDHVVSLADGGSHTWGNVACACRACNGRKGAASFGQLGLSIAA